MTGHGFETSHTEVEGRLLERALRPGAHVLDAGCGRTTRLAARRDRIERLIGIDIDAVAGAENRALDEFIAGDLCGRLPLADGSLDLVYANFVVEHLADPGAAFAQWRRVLRPGGALIVLTSNRASPLLAAAARIPERGRVAIKRHGAGTAERDVIPVHYRANTPAELESSLAAAGFTAAETHCVATLHRYAARAPAVAAALKLSERCLPPARRATVVGLWEVS